MNDRLLVAVLCILAGSALAEDGGLVPSAGLGAPVWLIERYPESWQPHRPEHGAWIKLVPGDPGTRAERLAADETKLRRHRAGILERREAFRQRRGAAVPFRIFSIERLFNGRVLLAWEGPQDAYYDWAWFDEAPYDKSPVEWLATVFDGVGEGSMDHSSAGERAILLGASLDAEDGMLESERLGGMVVIDSAAGPLIRGHVKVWDCEGNPPARPSVSLLINGQSGFGYGYNIENGILEFEIPAHSLLPGEQVAFASISSLVETTPEGDGRGRWGGVFRTADTLFVVPGNLEQHAVGFRRIESASEIFEHAGRPGLVRYVAELPAGRYDRWKLEIFHEKEGIVREWEGGVERTEGLSLSIPWDWKRANGEIAPFGSTTARLTLVHEGGSAILELKD